MDEKTPVRTADGSQPFPPGSPFANRDALYRVLVESVQDYAIYAIDRNGNIRTWNAGAQRLKGYTADEIIGRNFSVFYTPEAVAAKQPERELDTAARVGRLEDEDWRVRKDGSRFWANVIITALHSPDGNIFGFAKVTRDLTERRAAEEQARQLAAESAAHKAVIGKNRELEALAVELEEQAAELEAQTVEARELSVKLSQTNEQLQATLIEAEEAREAMAAAEQFARGIIDSIADPFVVLDAKWCFRYVNEPAIKALRGDQRANELVGKVLWDVFPELVGSDFEKGMRRAMKERSPITVEAFRAARGQWSALSSYPLADGGLAAQWKDITARKRAEEMAHYLARTSELLAAASLDYKETLNKLAQVVVPKLADWCRVDIQEADGTLRPIAFAHVNPDMVRAAHELNERVPPNPNASTSAANVLRTGKPELFPEVPDELLVAGCVDPEHLRLTRKFGIKSAMLVPLTARGRTLGVLTLVSAKSGRRYSDPDLELAMELARRAAMAVDNARLHQVALTATRDAEHANHAKTEFLTVMSHELRTPLNAIAGYADLLRMGLQGVLTPGQDDYLARIQRSQHHLLSLINDVLNFAKLEAGHVEPAIATVRVRQIVNEMESLLMPQIKQAGLTFEYHSCDDSLAACADPEKLRQVLVNLLSNAVKFTPSGGKVSLDCAARNEAVQIDVHDTGPGIPDDKLDAIFEPFVQLGSALVDRQSGTGLGLSISRDLARAMGGDLRVQSVEGQGSTFTVSLPRAGTADSGQTERHA